MVCVVYFSGYCICAYVDCSYVGIYVIGKLGVGGLCFCYKLDNYSV